MVVTWRQAVEKWSVFGSKKRIFLHGLKENTQKKKILSKNPGTLGSFGDSVRIFI